MLPYGREFLTSTVNVNLFDIGRVNFKPLRDYSQRPCRLRNVARDLTQTGRGPRGEIPIEENSVARQLYELTVGIMVGCYIVPQCLWKNRGCP